MYWITTMTGCVVQLEVLNLPSTIMVLCNSTEATTPVLLPICNPWIELKLNLALSCLPTNILREREKVDSTSRLCIFRHFYMYYSSSSPSFYITKFIEYSLKLYRYHQLILSLKLFTAFLFYQQIHTLHLQLNIFHRTVWITLTVFCKYSPSPQPSTINSIHPDWSLSKCN